MSAAVSLSIHCPFCDRVKSIGIFEHIVRCECSGLIAVGFLEDREILQDLFAAKLRVSPALVRSALDFREIGLGGGYGPFVVYAARLRDQAGPPSARLHGSSSRAL